MAKQTERRERAQQFLREQLARGAKLATTVEEAAAKARVDPQSLEQARADLGVVASRANTGHFRFWTNRTSSRHRRMTEFDP